MPIEFFNKVSFREYFLFLLPLFFVFHGYVENYAFVPSGDAFLLCVFYSIASIILAGLTYLFYKSWSKAALYTLLLLSFHFFFGSLHDGLKQVLGNIFLSSYSFLIPFFFILLLLLFFYLMKSRSSFFKLTRFLNILLLLLIIWDVFLLIGKIRKQSVQPITLAKGLQLCATCPKPDIYLIIADEYAGLKQLKEAFHFDNTPFENELGARGFHSIKDSRSNYNSTPFSVASILNFSYLPIRDVNHSNNDLAQIMQLIKNNDVQEFLSAGGYSIINNSYFDLKGLPSEATESILPSKTTYITGQTFLSRVKKDLMFNLITRFKFKWAINKSIYSNKVHNELLYKNTLKSISVNGPKFSYTHLMLPHPPFYFNEKGVANSIDLVTDEINKNAYVRYVQYANNKYLQLIDEILKKSGTPPIIILLSDHGFRGLYDDAGMTYDFVNIAHIYLPNKNYKPYYDGLSNVNLFRILLNTQFNQQLSLLKDTTIFLKD